MNFHCFSLLTIPDTDAGRRQYHLGDLDDKSAAKAMFHLHQQATGETILPLHLQKVAVLASIRREGDYILEAKTHISPEDERTCLENWLADSRSSPLLIAWDAYHHVIPVLRYRLLKYRLPLPRFFDPSVDSGVVDLQSMVTSESEPLKQFEAASLYGLEPELAIDTRSLWKQWLNEDYESLEYLAADKVKNLARLYWRYLVCNQSITDAQYHHEIERLAADNL